MKNTSTAWNYAKGLRQLMPKNFEWKDAGVDMHGRDDIQDLAKQLLS